MGRWRHRRPRGRGGRAAVRRARVTALAVLIVTAALAVLLAVLSHLAWPPVVVAILGTLPALYLAWLAVPALGYLRHGDTRVAWNLDRLGRSVKDVLTIADDLHARGIGVRILTGKLSGSHSPTGEGKFFSPMMAAFAELERDVQERTMAGLAATRTQGRNGGRPTAMDADKLAAATARRARGESPAQNRQAAR